MVLRMSSPSKNKHGVWCTRLVVPVELRALVGKRELKRTLRTKDEREAKLKHPLVLAEFQTQLEQARRRLEKNSQLTDAAIQSIIFDWQQKEALKLYSDPTATAPLIVHGGGMIEENNLPVTMVLDDIDNVGRLQVERIAEDNPVRPEVIEKKYVRYYRQLETLVADLFTEQFEAYSVVSDVDSEQYRVLLRSCAMAYVKITQTAMKKKVTDIEFSKYGVDQSRVDDDSVAGGVITSGTTVSELWLSYSQAVKRREPDKARSRLPDYATAVNRFMLMYPTKFIESMTKSDIAAFRAILERLPSHASSAIKKLTLKEQAERAEKDSLPLISQRNIKKQLNVISALFTFAIDEGIIETNLVRDVASRVKAPLPRSEIVKGYTPSELSRIFHSSLYSSNLNPKRADYGEAIRWIPLLLAYTGARAEEIAQLYVSDVDLTSDIPSIRLTDERDDQSLKTGKVRLVPIHSHLLDLGLSGYIDSLDGEGRLFPKLVASDIGKYHAAVSRWFSKYVAVELNISRSGLRYFHAFRHSFITACRENDVPEFIENEITGHAHQSVGRQYGTITIEKKKEAIELIPRWF